MHRTEGLRRLGAGLALLGFLWGVSAPASAAVKHAVVIGIDQYPTWPLEAAVADADAVSTRLGELGYKVVSLRDGAATLGNLRHQLGTELARIAPEDEVLIYFAGHGVTESLHSGRKEGYILPVDANVRDIYSTAISMTEMRNLIGRIPARHVLFVFDSCYSGIGLGRGLQRVSAEPGSSGSMPLS